MIKTSVNPFPESPSRWLRVRLLLVALPAGSLAATAGADDRDHRDHHDRDHRYYDGGYYNQPPPVVYGSPYYAPPPVVYGPGIGFVAPGLTIRIH